MLSASCCHGCQHVHRQHIWGMGWWHDSCGSVEGGMCIFKMHTGPRNNLRFNLAFIYPRSSTKERQNRKIIPPVLWNMSGSTPPPFAPERKSTTRDHSTKAAGDRPPLQPFLSPPSSRFLFGRTYSTRLWFNNNTHVAKKKKYARD